MFRTSLALLLVLFSFNLAAQENLAFHQPDSTALLPEANRKMLDFAAQKMGKKVGNGICADFVRAAMDYAVGSPTWFSDKKLDLRRELIKPGDILYMSWKRGRKSHVAVVTEVLAPHKVIVAHQNFNRMKYVVNTTYDLNQKIRDGRKVVIYRPVKSER